MQMTLDRPSPANAQVTTVPLDGRARVIVLRGVIGSEVAEALRSELLSAITADVRELVLDLSGVESISSPIRNLVAAAGSTLADRGGVLLTWNERHADDGLTYVIAELRDRASTALLPDRPSSTPASAASPSGASSKPEG